MRERRVAPLSLVASGLVTIGPTSIVPTTPSEKVNTEQEFRGWLVGGKRYPSESAAPRWPVFALPTVGVCGWIAVIANWPGMTTYESSKKEADVASDLATATTAERTARAEPGLVSTLLSMKTLQAVATVATLESSSEEGGRFLRIGDEAGTAPGDRKFRPDVEGLRAVAIVLVVLFHAGVPWLTGGFVGVDAFFVLSGFVITGLLLREHAVSGKTRLLGFYGREESPNSPRRNAGDHRDGIGGESLVGISHRQRHRSSGENSIPLLFKLPFHRHRYELFGFSGAALRPSELLVPIGRRASSTSSTRRSSFSPACAGGASTSDSNSWPCSRAALWRHSPGQSTIHQPMRSPPSSRPSLGRGSSHSGDGGRRKPAVGQDSSSRRPGNVVGRSCGHRGRGQF